MATILLLMDTGFAVWIRQALVQNNEQSIAAVGSEQKDVHSEIRSGTGLAFGIGRAFDAW